MNGSEILKVVRGFLDDEEEDYLWKEWELVDCLNRTVIDWLKGTRLLEDSYTTSITQIKLLAGLGLYSLDRTVLSVEGGRLVSQPVPVLTLCNRQFLDDTYPSWKTAIGTPRYIIIPMEMSTVTRIQFVPYLYTDSTGVVTGAIVFASGAKTLTMAGGVFTTHFAIGDTISVDGTVSNDGYFTIANVTDTEITVNETVVDETCAATTIRQQEDTANLNVTRLHVTEFTTQNLESLEPEIPWMYHRDLYDGIRGYAYLKQDVDAYDPKAAEKFLSKFAMNIEQAKRDIVRKKSVRTILTPHPGTI